MLTGDTRPVERSHASYKSIYLQLHTEKIVVIRLKRRLTVPC